MNYKKIYEDLCKSRSFRDKKRRKNYEIHHIKPRCFDGSDKDENLVCLTYREHFIAHKLLLKMYPDNHQLYTAILFMSGHTRYMNSHTHSKVRIKATLCKEQKNFSRLTPNVKALPCWRLGVKLDDFKIGNSYKNSVILKTCRRKGKGKIFNTHLESMIGLCRVAADHGFNSLSGFSESKMKVIKKVIDYLVEDGWLILHKIGKFNIVTFTDSFRSLLYKVGKNSIYKKNFDRLFIKNIEKSCSPRKREVIEDSVKSFNNKHGYTIIVEFYKWFYIIKPAYNTGNIPDFCYKIFKYNKNCFYDIEF